MASVLKVDKLDPQSGTALEIGTSGDTITVPSGVGLTLTDSTLLLPTTITSTTEVKTNKISPATGVAFALGDSGDTFTIPSGATITNSGTATGFGGGKVLQVVQYIHTSNDYTTSTSYSTLFTQAITPSATSSKILAIAAIGYNLYGNGSSSYPNGTIELLDDGDNVIARAFANASGNVSTDQTDQWNSVLTLANMDSPSTTSAHSYKISYKVGSGRFGILGDSGGSNENGSSLILIEIGA
jgi:hypothetical protein